MHGISAAGKLHIVCADLQRGPVLTFAIHIGTHGQVAVDCHLIALVQILRHIFSHAPPDGHAVKDGEIVTGGVLRPGIGSLSEGGAGNVVDIGQCGVRRQPSGDDNQVHTHDQPSCSFGLNAS